MSELKSRDGVLYAGEHPVLRGWESFSGWYWFATEKVEENEDDTIWYGFVQGFEEEWGTFSQRELSSLAPKVWEIPKENLHYSGRRR